MFDPSSKSFNTHLNFPKTFDDHPDSGICSPPLWKRTSPPKTLSPVSKAQVIARGQRELMEMVSNMPESCYELSMKDLVEVKTEEEEEEEEDDRKVLDEVPQRKKSKVVRKTKSDKWVDKSVNSNNGFLLKMVFPVSLGGGNKKKMKKRDENDASVTSKGFPVCSPRRSVSDLSLKQREVKDWWKDGFSESGRSAQRGVSRINSGSSKSSGGSSSRSNSDRSRSSLRDESNGCLSFLWNVHLRDRNEKFL